MYGIAVDIGATYVRVALGDDTGRLVDIRKFRTKDIKSPADLADNISRLIEDILEQHRVKVEGIAVGSAGPLDTRRGEIVNSPNMPFKRIPIVEPLRQKFDLPVALANDCNTAVVGEKIWGAGRGLDNIVYVTISTGIGGGAYVDGVLLLGKDGNAAEIGHIVVDSEERLVCGCGGRGHWEAYSSGSGLPKLARLLAGKYGGLWSISSLSRLEEITAKDIVEAYRGGDSFARIVIMEALKYNDYGFSAVINYFDPELITVGGSVALNNPDIFIEPLEKRVKRYITNRPPKIMITPLRENIVLKGALAIALGKEEKIVPT